MDNYVLRVKDLAYFFQSPESYKPKYVEINRGWDNCRINVSSQRYDFDKWYWYHHNKDYEIQDLNFGYIDDDTFIGVFIPDDENAVFYQLKEILKPSQEEYDFLFDFDGIVYIESNCPKEKMVKLVAKARKLYLQGSYDTDRGMTFMYIAHKEFITILLELLDKDKYSWLVHFEKYEGDGIYNDKIYEIINL